jgi:protein involved in polysaccharide export with SLBB domain
MNREVRVSAGGTISLPLLGDIRAEGLTPMELEGGNRRAAPQDVYERPTRKRLRQR